MAVWEGEGEAKRLATQGTAPVTEAFRQRHNAPPVAPAGHPRQGGGDGSGAGEVGGEGLRGGLADLASAPDPGFFAAEGHLVI